MRASPAGPRGRILLVGTPIGNLGDLSPRAVESLAGADVVACEDTRRTGRLLAHAGVRARRLVSLHGHNEAARTAELLSLVEGGETIAVVSDAGMPSISDPGEYLVAEAAARGVEVVVVPGPAAVVAAIAVSGMGGSRWAFEGFVPRRGPERRARLQAIACSSSPTVVYEAPHRLAALLGDLVSACGEGRPVAICRELTKLHEEVWRGSLGEAAERSRTVAPRGEHVVVVGAAPPPERPRLLDVRAALTVAMGAGATRSRGVSEVAEKTGAAKREVYEVALSLEGWAGND